MSATIDRTATTPKRVLMVVANPTVSELTGWPIGFWASELVHPWYEFTEHGYDVTMASPEGGEVRVDALSDPRDESGYSAEDVLSLGFLSAPRLTALLQDTPRLADLDPATFDAIVVCGGQAPMYQFRGHGGLQAAVAHRGRRARAGRALRRGRAVEGLRGPRRAAHHGPAAVLGAARRAARDRGPRDLVDA